MAPTQELRVRLKLSRQQTRVEHRVYVFPRLRVPGRSTISRLSSPVFRFGSTMQAAQTNEHQAQDEAHSRAVGEPTVHGYETTSFVNPHPPTSMPEPVGAGRYQAPTPLSMPQDASDLRSLPRPKRKRVNTCGGAARFDLPCLVTSMVASGLCAVAVYVLFASTQQCLPTFGNEVKSIAPLNQVTRRRRSLSNEDCFCSCTFDPRDKGWSISLETPNNRPTCDVESYTVSVNGKKVTNAADLELDLARDLLDLLTAVLLNDNDNEGSKGGDSEGGSATTSTKMTTSTPPETGTRPPTTLFSDVDGNNEVPDLFVNPEVTIIEPFGEMDIGSGEDIWGSVPEVEYTLPIDFDGEI
ncbi:Oidioi.mRNA.OKI2018_I69.chr1.g431.t1.cds [Oikopleura dioica]|uniref:Oidioi.mRNA.OKI2018_I69.chr1.g431.t1.cds n=1 Tax=Oikopleura dioica TaxID=34765 RepID=A0ABN7SNI8_OIKDI|nr:Oidioi.mRNA.OKI2018_I69.chr1.g431.t1.cds [Oikopleura dioica]